MAELMLMSRKPKEDLISPRSAGTSGTTSRKRRAQMKISRSSQSGWRTKLHPFFIRMIEGYKKIAQLSASSSAKDRQEAQRLIRETPPDLIKEARPVRRKLQRAGGFAVASLGLTHLPPGSTISEGHFMLAWLCWHRTGIPLPQLVKQYDEGNWEATKKLHRVIGDYEKWRYGKLRPDDLRFKSNRDHNIIIMAGLDLGLTKLTENDLAEFFDALCPCGKEHSPENLKKARARVIKLLAKLGQVGH